MGCCVGVLGVGDSFGGSEISIKRKEGYNMMEDNLVCFIYFVWGKISMYY